MIDWLLRKNSIPIVPCEKHDVYNFNCFLKIYSPKIYFPSGIAVSAYSISTQKIQHEKLFAVEWIRLLEFEDDPDQVEI